MEQNNQEKSLKKRIRQGTIRREDVARRLAEIAFGKANDCVRLVLEETPRVDKLELSLLSEVKRNEKGTVEIKLVDRLKALEQLLPCGRSEPMQGESSFSLTVVWGLQTQTYRGCCWEKITTQSDGESLRRVAVAVTNLSPTISRTA